MVKFGSPGKNFHVYDTVFANVSTDMVKGQQILMFHNYIIIYTHLPVQNLTFYTKH